MNSNRNLLTIPFFVPEKIDDLANLTFPPIMSGGQSKSFDIDDCSSAMIGRDGETMGSGKVDLSSV